MRQTPIATALVLLGCTVGSGSPVPPDASIDAPRDASADAPIDASHADPWDDTLDRIARARCELGIACEAWLGGPPAGALAHEAACHPRGVAEREAIERALRMGRVELDREAVDGCLEALGAGTVFCPDARASPFELRACALVLVPRVDAGAPCDASRWGTSGDVDECLEGYHCADAPSCGARCMPDLGVGEPCFEDGECAAPLRCVFGACAGDPEAGDPCSSDGACAPAMGRASLFCVDGACTRVAAAENGDCTRFPCAEGLLCHAGVCADPITSPIACAYREMCDPPRGTCAHDGSCILARAIGALCDPHDTFGCAAGVCGDVDGTGFRCQVGWVGAACSLAASICSAFGLHCVASPFAPTGIGTCQPMRVEGVPCVAPRDCPAGTRCEDERCREIAMPGATCGISRVCPVTHACVGHCVPRPWIGEPCDERLRCLSGACVDGTCEVVAPGSECVHEPISYGPCRGGYCSGICPEARPSGEICGRWDADCPLGEVCRAHDDGNRCAPPCP